VSGSARPFRDGCGATPGAASSGFSRRAREVEQVPRRGTCQCVRAGSAVPRARRRRDQRGFRDGRAARVGGAAGSEKSWRSRRHGRWQRPSSALRGRRGRRSAGTRAQGPSRQLVSPPARHAQRSPRTADPARTHLQVALRATCRTSRSASCWRSRPRCVAGARPTCRGRSSPPCAAGCHRAWVQCDAGQRSLAARRPYS
jgi:hypothetical protein